MILPRDDMIGKTVVIAALMLVATLGSGCVTSNDASEGEQDDAQEEEKRRSYVTFFLLFPDPCPPDHAGTTTYNDTSSSWTEAGSCGPELRDHIPDEQRCATFRIHDDSFQLVEGEGISANVTIPATGPGYVNAEFIWRDDDGIVAEAISRTVLMLRDRFIFRSSTVVDRDSSGDIWFEVYNDGGKCGGVQYAGSNPARFCTHAPDHEHGVAPAGGHCTPW